MKPRHKFAYRLHARTVLADLKIAIDQDFHTLTRAQIDGLLVEADRVRYQQPQHANGSRARYFHDRLQRHASMDGEQ
jgi:hypothetical protein